VEERTKQRQTRFSIEHCFGAPVAVVTKNTAHSELHSPLTATIELNFSISDKYCGMSPTTPHNDKGISQQRNGTVSASNI
jgi:hypothetical protein